MKTLLGIMLLTIIASESPRRVLLFYTNGGLEKLNAQQAILDAHQKDIQERDIKVHSFSYSEKAAEWKKWKIDGTGSFTFVLIGRDGGQKLKSSDVVTAEKLFSLIDAMPMRQNEIEHSQSNKPE